MFGRETVDVAPFREEAERQHRQGRSWCDMVLTLGWMKPDTDRLARTLGRVRHHRGGQLRYARRVSLRTAEALCEMLGVDPVDYGL